MGNFEQKEYWNYLKTLEEQFSDPEKLASAKKEYNDELNIEHEKKETPRKGKKKRSFWCVLKSKDTVLAIFLSVVIVVLSAAIVVVGIKTNELRKTKLKEAQTTSSNAEDVVPEEESKIIEYAFPEETPDIIAGNDAKYAIVIDKTNGKVVAARNAHEKAYPASTTKIMTLLVAAENIENLNDTFTMTYEITDPLFKQGASIAGFLNGEVITMTDLLYGLILPSGADAAVALANKIAGGEEAFVTLMNEKVAELGLKNTHFSNVSGLFDEQNYTTAYDMSIILSAAMQDDLCRTILSTKKYTTQKTEQNPKGIPLSSTLFDYMYGTEPEIATIMGGKTGYVSQSGYCIASFGKNNSNGNEYVIVSLCNSSRWPAFHGQIDLYKEYAK